MSNFEDLFLANDQFVKEFKSQDLTGQAKKGLAIVTCMDSRIDPLRIVGMKAGDAKILIHLKQQNFLIQSETLRS